MTAVSLDHATMSRRRPARRPRGRLYAAALGTLLAFSHLPQSWAGGAGPFASPRGPVVMSDFLGMNTPFLFFPPFIYARQMAAERALGLKWARIDVHWALLERTKGSYDFSVIDQVMKSVKEAGLEPVVYVVGTPPFASSAPPAPVPPHDNWGPKENADYLGFVKLLANRYPQVKYWQIWNEPNLPSFWLPTGDSAAYGKLASDTAEMIRRDLPDRHSVLAGMAYYSQMPLVGGRRMLDDLLALGIQRNVDVVDYHPYSDTPEGDPAPGKMNDFISQSGALNRRLRDAGAHEIWASEFGWSTYKGEKIEQSIISEETQADYLLRRIALMMRLGFDRVFYFALTDLDFRVPVRDRSYGLLDLNANAKPAYNALKYFLATTGDELSAVADVLAPDVDAGLYAFTWARPDGKRLVFLWARDPQSVRIDCCPTAILHDPVTRTRQELAAEDGKLTVPLSQSLRILELP